MRPRATQLGYARRRIFNARAYFREVRYIRPDITSRHWAVQSIKVGYLGIDDDLTHAYNSTKGLSLYRLQALYVGDVKGEFLRHSLTGSEGPTASGPSEVSRSLHPWVSFSLPAYARPEGRVRGEDGFARAHSGQVRYIRQDTTRLHSVSAADKVMMVGPWLSQNV
jgi:hypothetical protein